MILGAPYGGISDDGRSAIVHLVDNFFSKQSFSFYERMASSWLSRVKGVTSWPFKAMFSGFSLSSSFLEVSYCEDA